ncbi:MAG: hypothetical protein ABFS08_04820 [Pseudomonadota bacterium]
MNTTRTSLLVACCACIGMASNAFAISEVESNDSIPTAQTLAPASSHSIDGVMGVIGESTHDDLDYFAFHANAGDVLDVDIDNGYGGAGYVNTIIAIFDESGTLLRMNDNADSLDEGSISIADSRIDAFVAPASGIYTVGVSTFPRFFNLDGNTSVDSRYARRGSINPTGDYTLNLSGMTDGIKQINIEIKPGNNKLAPLNPRSKGKIPVAIMGSNDFDVDNIDQNSLTFGSSGSENSLNKCQKVTRDINNDGYGDKLCHFENRAAGFRSGDIEGILMGTTNGGTDFVGRSILKVVPSKRK